MHQIECWFLDRTPEGRKYVGRSTGHWRLDRTRDVEQDTESLLLYIVKDTRWQYIWSQLPDDTRPLLLGKAQGAAHAAVACATRGTRALLSEGTAIRI